MGCCDNCGNIHDLRDQYLCFDCLPRHIQLRILIERADNKINEAYWFFSRCARADPPSSVVPNAYADRSRYREELVALDYPSGP